MCKRAGPRPHAAGVRFFAGEVSDAYLVRADIQRGLSMVVWRGRHVAEPTELTERRGGRLRPRGAAVGRALEAVLAAGQAQLRPARQQVPHLHTHIVPRYADDPRPGWPFPFPDPDRPMPEERLMGDVEALRRAVDRQRR